MRRLLVVEDSAAMRGLIASILAGLEAVEVVEVPSGYEALRRLPRETFDLIVMDINMPDINGLELLGFVRSHPTYATTPVLIVTTQAGEEDRRRAMSLGANAYLCKPFTPEALQAEATRLLGGGR